MDRGGDLFVLLRCRSAVWTTAQQTVHPVRCGPIDPTARQRRFGGPRPRNPVSSRDPELKARIPTEIRAVMESDDTFPEYTHAAPESTFGRATPELTHRRLSKPVRGALCARLHMQVAIGSRKQFEGWFSHVRSVRRSIEEAHTVAARGQASRPENRADTCASLPSARILVGKPMPRVASLSQEPQHGLMIRAAGSHVRPDASIARQCRRTNSRPLVLALVLAFVCGLAVARPPRPRKRSACATRPSCPGDGPAGAGGFPMATVWLRSNSSRGGPGLIPTEAPNPKLRPMGIRQALLSHAFLAVRSATSGVGNGRRNGSMACASSARLVKGADRTMCLGRNRGCCRNALKMDASMGVGPTRCHPSRPEVILRVSRPVQKTLTPNGCHIRAAGCTPCANVSRSVLPILQLFRSGAAHGAPVGNPPFAIAGSASLACRLDSTLR